jgi:hypothetical protein
LRLFLTVESAVSDIIAVYCENRTVHTHTLYRQNAVSSVETGGTYSYPFSRELQETYYYTSSTDAAYLPYCKNQIAIIFGL